MSNHVLMILDESIPYSSLACIDAMSWYMNLTEAAFSLMSLLVPLKHLMSKYFNQAQRYNCLQYLVMTTYSLHLNLIYSNLQMFEKTYLGISSPSFHCMGPTDPAWIFDNYPTPWCRQCQEHGIDTRTYGLRS